MKKRNNSSARHIRPKHWLQVAVNCCFVVLFAFPLLISASANRSANGFEQEHQIGVHHDAFFLPAPHSPHHSNGTFLAPMVCEVADGSESENDGDHEIVKLGHNPAADVPAFIHNGKSLFLQLRLKSESLTRVSLVVLHHSWKSFLI